MSQKPLKRDVNIQPLSKDHHFTLLFCWKIRTGIRNKIEPERIRKYVEYFWNADMKTHFREEEEILFAPVQDEMVQQALDDHIQIAHDVNHVEAASDAAVEEALNTLADRVEAHVRYEERELFPHLERVLTSDQLAAIGLALSKEEPLQENYEDEFWVKK